MDKNLNKTTLKVASGAAAALATTLGVSAHADTVDDVNVPFKRSKTSVQGPLY